MKRDAAKTDCKCIDRKRTVLQADERIVNYMKARVAYAKTVACSIAVQLFALAVYFCLYALIFSNLFYSSSEKTGKLIMICIAIVIAVGLCVLNVFTVIRSKEVYIKRPDAIALRDGKEIVSIAYSTARPVLIYKITYSLIICGISGLVYITLLIIMKDAALAGLYGRICCCLAVAAAVLIAYPCVDRITCYRALLGETHDLITDDGADRTYMYTAALVIPPVICLWYILRYYGSRPDVAWIVFPVAALFSVAIAFLRNWVKSVDKAGDIC